MRLLGLSPPHVWASPFPTTQSISSEIAQIETKQSFLTGKIEELSRKSQTLTGRLLRVRQRPQAHRQAATPGLGAKKTYPLFLAGFGAADAHGGPV